MRRFILTAAAMCLAACQNSENTEPAAEDNAHAAVAETSADPLAAVLAAQPADVQARYKYRHPQETLAFFEIEPGMTVVEALPGGGWYTKVLLPVIGSDGVLIGADYAQDMWPLFGFFSDERIEEKKTWTDTFPVEASEWGGENTATIQAFKFGSMPDSLAGTADRVVLIRALHNLNRFESAGGFLTAAIADSYNILKPGGIVGIVQHEARDDRPDEWADGSRGYLKKDFLIEQMQQAGFEFVGEIDVNQNPNDQPGDGDVVWRLPPTYNGAMDDADKKAAVDAIGESNRMTLKFRKPE